MVRMATRWLTMYVNANKHLLLTNEAHTICFEFNAQGINTYLTVFSFLNTLFSA